MPLASHTVLLVLVTSLICPPLSVSGSAYALRHWREDVARRTLITHGSAPLASRSVEPSEDVDADSTSASRLSSRSTTWWSPNGANTGKLVVAHMIVGNTYHYTIQQWKNDILLANAQGIDAFALNMGQDSWEIAQIGKAYAAAGQSGTSFKLFPSFDMTAIDCSNDAFVTSLIKTYANHPHQLKDSQGAAWVSTFDGGTCKSASQWQNDVHDQGIKTRFVPAFFNDLTNNVLTNLVPAINGDFLWYGAWPTGNTNASWVEDAYRLSRDGLRAGDYYMTSVSPWFYVHYPGRNNILRSDDWLYVERWIDLYSHRDKVKAVQIVTWNDYGESSYIGPIGQDQPDSQAWVNGYDHQAFLKMTGYFASLFKTGKYPSIHADKIFMWARPHPRDANAPQDSVGKPNHFEYTSDKLWVVLFATGPGTLTLTMGSNSGTHAIHAGINKLSLDLAVADHAYAKLVRNGKTIFTFQPSLGYTTSPKSYNYNVAAVAGP